MENLPIVDLFDQEIKSSEAKTSYKKLEAYKSDLEKYLNPPYTFELPKNPGKLMPNDEGYDYYICRNNVSCNIANAIHCILTDEDISIARENRERLAAITQEILQYRDNGHNKTPEEMRRLKGLVEEANYIVSAIGTTVH